MDQLTREDGLDLQLGPDAGLNSSAAWTEHFDTAPLDDGETSRPLNVSQEWSPGTGTPARALENFKGDSQSSELSLVAGQQLFILLEDVMEGWSLARVDGSEGEIAKMGLIPRTHYAFTSNLELSPQVVANTPPTRTVPLASLDEISSPSSQPGALAPIEPQITGMPLRRLRAKSINRFSSFVTSGAEDWINNGSVNDLAPSSVSRRIASDDSQAADDPYGSDRPESFFTETPPAWRVSTPQFHILVHSPSKRTSTIAAAYTVYSVTSMFPDSAVAHVTVLRRFSQFAFLHAALARRLPGVALPPLPEKQYAGRFNDDFVEARRGDLERWLNRIVRHPLARGTEVVMFFLGCDSDMEWKRRLPTFLAAYPTPGPSFYGHVFHPQFNVDAEEAGLHGRRFKQYSQHVSRTVAELRRTYTFVREAGTEMATASRALSYSILALICPMSDSANFKPSEASSTEDPQIDLDTSAAGWAPHNGAWCWREECSECLGLSKALQRVAETFQVIADLHDDHARRFQLSVHESLKDISHPSKLYAPVIDIHHSALSRYTEANEYLDTSAKEAEIAARAETVLNTTLAEFETYHSQKNEDVHRITADHLDGEILLHEQILLRLRAAREVLDRAATGAGTPPSTPSDSPRKPSLYERDLSNGVAVARSNRNEQPALPLPVAHVFDSTSGRLGLNVVVEPVAQVVKEGVTSVSSLLGIGPGAAGGRSPTAARAWTGPASNASNLPGNVATSSRSGSVFSRFW